MVPVREQVLIVTGLFVLASVLNGCGQETPAVQTAARAAAGKVKVEYYYEAACPVCSTFLVKVLNKTLSHEGMLGPDGAIDLHLHPFGNAYFVTEKCGGAGTYSLPARKCYNTECGKGAKNPSPDCYTGDIVCQHGGPECTLNRYLACSKKVTSYKAEKFMPYATCLDMGFSMAEENGEYGKLAEFCAKFVAIDINELNTCHSSSDGQQAMIEEAKSTPPHTLVPYIVVNGQPLTDPYDLLPKICSEYSGEKVLAPCTKSSSSRRLLV
mmetsp:Transcript_158792/g.280549  ORF Transcript_158792/g.280549 Transcript_158792/m.280549 type:complete len:268 (+) Transcript_158792:63-866(+)